MKKNNYIKSIELEYGKPIREVFRQLYLEEKLSVGDLANRLQITKSIAYRWLRKFGVKFE